MSKFRQKIILFNKRRNQDFFRSTFWSTPRPKFKSPSSHPRHLASKSAFYPTPTFRVDQKYFDVSTPDGAGRRSRRAADLRSSPPKKNHFMVASPFLKASTLSTSTLRRRRRRKKFPGRRKLRRRNFFPRWFSNRNLKRKNPTDIFSRLLGSCYFLFCRHFGGFIFTRNSHKPVRQL